MFRYRHHYETMCHCRQPRIIADVEDKSNTVRFSRLSVNPLWALENVHSVDNLNTKTRRWHVTISCQPDGRPPQPVRPWKSGRVHLADGSKVVALELPYSTEFGRESRKLVSGVRKYGKFDDGR